MSNPLTLPMEAAARFSGELWSIHEPAIPKYLQAMARRERGAFAIAGATKIAAQIDGAKPAYVRLGSTAVFLVEGVLAPGGLAWWGECDTAALAAAFHAAAGDDDVEQGLMLLNTPGGMVLGHDVLMESVAEFKAAGKKLVGQVDQMCCSGGYWLLSQCDEAYAGPRDTIGSIGVRSHVWDWSQYFAEVGVEVVSFATGPFKAMGLQGTEVTEEQRAFWQERVEYPFGDFKRDVMAGRGMSDEMFAAIGDGRYWYGEQAVGLGLIDKTQRLNVTLAGLDPASTKPQDRSRSMGATNDNTPAADAPKTVTTAELKKTFPGSTAEWREDQVESGATMADASIAYANLQQKLREDAEAKLKEAEEAKAKADQEAEENANKPQRGVAAVGGGADGGGSEIDYYAEAEQLRRDKPGMQYGESLRAMVRKYGEPAMQAFRRGKLPS